MANKFDAAVFRRLWKAKAKDRLPAEVEDGGKGSGNFGHKGRPGQVGGSGKGGGKAVAYAGANGSLTGEGEALSDYKNPHVTDDARKSFADWAQKRKYSMQMYGGTTPKALMSSGIEVRKEIAARVKLRKKAKDLPDWNKEGAVQTEDIYDALRDIRSFGATTPEAQSKIKVVQSDIDEERTNAIIKEALDSLPTDWLENADFPVNIHIVNWAGRAHYFERYANNLSEGEIFVYTKTDPEVVKELELPTDEITDMGIANQLRHELGHYIEESNYGIGQLCRDYLSKRTANSETIYNYNGEEIKPDKFYSSYMGRQYSTGLTEILSMCLQGLGTAWPEETMTNTLFGTSDKDPETYKFALGLLAFKNGGYF